MNFHEERKVLILGLIGAVVVTLLGLALPYMLSHQLEFTERIGLAQLSFSAVAFLAIFITLFVTIFRFLKSMARPKLEVIFGESGTSEGIIIIPHDAPQDKNIQYRLMLYVLNTGNAITDLFQIDFEIPKIFNPTISSTISGTVETHTKNSTHDIVSLINKKVYVCFVKRPTRTHSLALTVNAKRFQEYPNPLVIPYKIYGDWAETKEGKLKINIKKQEKNLNDPS